MPPFPPAALDDTEASNQRQFAARGQQLLTDDATVARTSNQNFVISNNLQNAVIAQALLGPTSAGPEILQGREVQAQPQTTGTLVSPGVFSGVPAAGNTTPAQPVVVHPASPTSTTTT